MAKHRYLIALGSNMRHRKYGDPHRVLRAALAALDKGKFEVEAVSPLIDSAPLGPSRRRYANGVAIVSTHRDPDEVLRKLAKMERKFGRKSGGRPWGARVLDLDIVLWDGGPWTSDRLVIPHPAFRQRDFVLGPALTIAGGWRDPLTGLSVKQLHARLTKPRPVPS